MVELKSKLTILVCTCDVYEDLWYPFFKLLKEHWPDLDCDIILNTETKNYAFEGLNIKTYSFGKSEYGQRILNHLNEVKTPYLLLLLDDFFIRRSVDTEQIGKMISFMDEHDDVAAMYCQESKYINDENSCHPFYAMNRYAPYKLNMQAAIWRTSTLKNYWRAKDNPWIWEVFVNYTTFDDENKFYSLKDLNESPVFYGYNPDGMGVFRGKWVIEDVKPLFEKYGINVDFNKRGTYKKEAAISRFPIIKTMKYVFCRIPLKYAFMYSLFHIRKVLLRRKREVLDYDEYLAEKYK